MVTSQGHRERLLAAAQALTLSKGFPATRVDEVCAAAGCTKGSFYHHFDSKEALAHALVEHYFEGIREAFCGPDFHAIEDGRERLDAFLENAIRVAKGPTLKHGCLLGSFALDLSETHPELRVEIEARLEGIAKVVEEHLRAAVADHPPAGSPSLPTLARQFVVTLEGSIVLAKAMQNHNKVAEALRFYRDTVHALLPA